MGAAGFEAEEEGGGREDLEGGGCRARLGKSAVWGAPPPPPPGPSARSTRVLPRISGSDSGVSGGVVRTQRSCAVQPQH